MPGRAACHYNVRSSHHHTMHIARQSCWSLQRPQCPSPHYAYCQTEPLVITTSALPITTLCILPDRPVCHYNVRSAHHRTMHITRQSCWSFQRPQCPSSHYAYCQTELLVITTSAVPITTLRILPDRAAGHYNIRSSHHHTMLIARQSCCSLQRPQCTSPHYAYCQTELLVITTSAVPITTLCILPERATGHYNIRSAHHHTMHIARQSYWSLQRPQCPSPHYAYCQTELLVITTSAVPITTLCLLPDRAAGHYNIHSAHHHTMLIARQSYWSLQRPQCPSPHYAYCQTELLFIKTSAVPITTLCILPDRATGHYNVRSAHHHTMHTARQSYWSLQRPQCPSPHYAYCYRLVFSFWFTTLKHSALRSFTDRNIIVSIFGYRLAKPSDSFFQSIFLNNFFSNFLLLFCRNVEESLHVVVTSS